MLFHKLIASIFGIGYIKGGGTIAAFVCCACWYFAWTGNYPAIISVIITGIIIGIGIWSGNMVESVWGKDHSCVVIDEVAGMAVSLLFVPVSIKFVVAGFILFRFFDILKPFYIRRLEALPGGWGVMADDVLAGVYSNVILHTFIAITAFTS